MPRMQSATAIGDYGFCWGLIADCDFLQTEILFGSITPSTLNFFTIFLAITTNKNDSANKTSVAKVV